MHINTINTNNPADLNSDIINWSDVSNMRATLALAGECQTENTLYYLPQSSGFIVDNNTIVGSHHGIFSANQDCDEYSYKVKAYLAVDRKYADGVNAARLVDSRPPNRHLALNRIHALSLDQTTAQTSLQFINFLNGDHLVVDTTLHTLPPSSTTQNIQDISYLTAYGLNLGPHNTTVPIGAIFDSIEVPTTETEYISINPSTTPVYPPPPPQGQYSTEVWGYSINQDLLVDLSTNNNDPRNLPGSYIYNFENNASIGDVINYKKLDQPDTFNSTITSLVSYDAHLRVSGFSNSSSNPFQRPCTPAHGLTYTNECFTTTMDILPGSSGGPVIHRPWKSYSKAYPKGYLAGVIQGGISSGRWISEYESENDLVRTNPDTYLTKVITVSPTVVNNEPNLQPSPSPNTPYKPNNIDADSDCYGRDGCTGENFAYFGCYNLPVQYTGPVAVGIYGGPTSGVEGVTQRVPVVKSAISGIGTLGLICYGWFNKTEIDTPVSSWSSLEAIGLHKGDGLLNKITGLSSTTNATISKFKDLNKYTPLAFQNASLNQQNLHPLPFKMCPSPSYLSGLSINKDSSGYILGIGHIECKNPIDETVASYSLYSEKPFEQYEGPESLYDYTQYIGVSGPSANEEMLSCPNEKYLIGIKISIPDDPFEYYFSRINALGISCADYIQ